ncbi:hypothetical protein SZ64_11960 [Erythrobacter sp. SG61-1L]|uniref:hypothetical protein n=1 Tax=Erythrobacter sp. SG61-1L TaxID=1603897 RepID=UPI0006C8FDAE|nr:hypothetical protein [Erythrobacter sp. SG61-1L]KPL68744.1 hypothetical protein SZ64_11960 [Erythrobacter sp. SG61-1L]
MASGIPDDRDLIAALFRERFGKLTIIVLSDGRVLEAEQVRECEVGSQGERFQLLGSLETSFSPRDVVFVKDAGSGEILWETPVGKLEYVPRAPSRNVKALGVAVLSLMVLAGANFVGEWGLFSPFDRQVLFGALFIGLVFNRFSPRVIERA